MSVFTPVSRDEARALLARYTLGELESLEGIAQGIENTNFFLDTTTGHYVLTLFEKIPPEDLPFYVGLMHHLAEHEIRCPAPMALQDGSFLTMVCGKPAVIVTRLAGVPHMAPTPEPCRKVGRILADIHEAGLEYDAGLANWRGQAWRWWASRSACGRRSGPTRRRSSRARTATRACTTTPSCPGA